MSGLRAFFAFAFIICTSIVQAAPLNIETCEALLKVAQKNSRTSRTITTNINDPILRNNGRNKDDLSQRNRETLVTLGKEEDLGKLAVRAVLSDLRASSEQLADRLVKAKNSNSLDAEAQIYDVIGIGLGIHMGIVSNTFMAINAQIKFLIVENTDLVAANFAAGPVFSLNSSSRPSDAGSPVSFGSGNLNELINGPVQVPDLSARKFPSASKLAAAATLNQATNDAAVLFKHDATVVEDRLLTQADWPARYRVTLTSDKNETFVVYANVVIDGTGLGEPKVLENLRAEYKRQLAESKTNDVPPTITTTEDARERFYNSQTPMREYVNQSVAVIGGGPKAGDSSKVFMEVLDRLEDEDVYGADKTQAGNVKKIVWVGPTLRDCKDYTDNSRVRYDGLAAGLKKFFSGARDKGEIEPVGGRLVAAVREGNQWRIVIQGEDRTVSRVVDKIVFGTGYENSGFEKYRALLAQGNITMEGVNLRDIPTRDGFLLEVRSRDQVRTIGKKLINVGTDQDIYFVGPGYILADPNDIVNVPQNRVAIALLGPKSAELASFINETRIQTRVDSRYVLTAKDSFGPSTNTIYELPISVKKLPKLNPYDDIYLAAKLAVILQKFNLTADAEYSLQIEKTDNTNIFNVTAPVDGVTWQKILSLINRDEELKVLIYNLIGSGNRARQVRFSVRTDGERNLNFDSLSLLVE